MQGRNGADHLCRFTLAICLILLVIDWFVRHWILWAVILLLLIWTDFRMLSRNVPSRQKENRIYLNVVTGIGKRLRLQKNRFRDRKTHVYRKCPACKRTLRLPKIKGEHTVCCPCCGNRFEMKV